MNKFRRRYEKQISHLLKQLLQIFAIQIFPQAWLTIH